MPEYDAVAFDPPAPIAMAEVRALLNTSAIADVPLLIDTGADVTLLPRAVVERLGV